MSRRQADTLFGIALLFAAAAATLGLYGFWHEAPTGSFGAVSHAVYSTVQLFALGDGGGGTDRPVTVHLARLAAAAAIGLTICVVAARYIGHLLQRVWTRWRGGHAIVCGLGRRGGPLVRRLRAEGRAVVAICRHADSSSADEAREFGVTVIEGNATRAEVLEEAGINRATDLFAFCGSDDANALVAMEAVNASSKRSKGHLDISTEVDAATIRDLLRERLATMEPEGRAVDVHVFDLADLAARKLFRRHRLDHRPGEQPSARPHLMLIGLGELGRAVLLQAIHVAHFPGSERLRVTLVDPLADEIWCRVQADHPCLSEKSDPVVQVELLKIRFGESAVSIDELTQRLEDADEVMTIIVAVGPDDEEAVRVCRLLATALEGPGPSVQLLVRLHDTLGLGELLTGNTHPRLKTHTLTREEVVVLDTLAGRNEDRLARAIHASYVDEFADDPPKLSQLPWDRLPEVFRAANRAAADFTFVVFPAFGHQIVEAEDAPGDAIKTFDDAELEAMAKLEHRRWCVERRMAGWRLGPWDAKRRRSPDLIPWADLSEQSREKDRVTIRQRPEHLRAAGYKLVRPKSQNLNHLEGTQKIARESCDR